MTIKNQNNKLIFKKFAKEDINDDAIYFLGDYSCKTLHFIIFKGINNAKRLNKEKSITSVKHFDNYIDRLFT